MLTNRFRQAEDSKGAPETAPKPPLGEGLDGNAREVLSYDLHLTGQLSGHAMALSAALHILMIVTPLPAFLVVPSPPEPPPTIEVELDLHGTAAAPTLPPVFPVHEPKQQPSPGGEENRPLPALGAEIVQLQTIVSDPPDSTHPRQTLLKPQALDSASLQVPDIRLPNVVIPPTPDALPLPAVITNRLPAPNSMLGASQVPLPPRPQSTAELVLKETRLANLLPRLTLPRAAPGERTSVAPRMNAPLGGVRGGGRNAPALLALSGQPAAPRPVLELPDTNLHAKFTAGPYSGSGSPGGVPDGLPESFGGSGGGPGGLAGGSGNLVAPNILVMPMESAPPAPVVAGTGDGSGPSTQPRSSRSPAPRPERRNRTSAEPPPGQSPQQRAQALQEAIQQRGQAGGRPIYTTYLFLANLTSQSSTWRLRFTVRAPTEAAQGGGNPAARRPATEGIIAAPVVVRKADPCYPTDAGRERIEGTVVLYGVIRADGGVEDVVVVSGLDAQLDQRAADAFARSRFEPARQGRRPLAVEAMVEIPFRLAACL